MISLFPLGEKAVINLHLKKTWLMWKYTMFRSLPSNFTILFPLDKGTAHFPSLESLVEVGQEILKTEMLKIHGGQGTKVHLS